MILILCNTINEKATKAMELCRVMRDLIELTLVNKGLKGKDGEDASRKPKKDGESMQYILLAKQNFQREEPCIWS